MHQADIKKLLRMNGCRVWQLCDAMHVSRDCYYRMSHRQFKGHEVELHRAIKKLINKSKAGDVDAD